MERHYKAFISYRHLPLEVSVAKKTHRSIEHYVVPKELRRDGEKKLGLVFRDQDELPIASNLTANIERALDNSEFLIVICSPETAKSRWVLREIDYFLQHHDRDHVLAVLADGTPETAFPPQLTELRGEDGAVLERIEPIAANIVAPTRAKRDRLFRVEILRILAALVGCPFDALYRREQRWRRRRAGVALTAAGLIAAAFIGMLLNRNAQIRAQLVQTQINESRALATLSEKACDEGDFLGALRMALEALPDGENGRPYVPEAERALSRELNPYRLGVPVYSCSIEQETVIDRLVLSGNGETILTEDPYGCLRVYDAATGAERWSLSSEGDLPTSVCFAERAGGVLSAGFDAVTLYALEDGAVLWRRGDLELYNFRTASAAGSLGLNFCYDESAPVRTETVSLIDLRSGETLKEIPIGPGPGRFCVTADIDAREERAVFLLLDPIGRKAELCLLNLADGTVRSLEKDLPFTIGPENARAVFTGTGDVLFACDSMEGNSFVRLYGRERDYARRFSTPFGNDPIDAGITQDERLRLSLTLLDMQQGRVAVGNRGRLLTLDAESGELLWERTLPGSILSAEMYRNACFGLVLSNGTVSFCTDGGILSSMMKINFFQSGYPVYAGALQGESYPESVFVLNPDGFRKRAVILRYPDDGAMVRIAAAPADVARMILIPSETGKRFACLGYNIVNTPVCCTMLDAAEGSTGETFALPDPELWRRPGGIRLTDDGMLLADGHALDTATLALTRTGPEQRPDGVPEGAVWTADGNRFAVLEGRTITLYAADGAALCALEAPPAVTGLLFAREGALLFAFSETGTLCIYDAEKGNLLQRSEYGAYDLYFHRGDVRCTVSEIPEEKRLLLFCDSLQRSEPVCIVLDTESWTCAGICEGAAARLNEADRMLVSPYLGGVWLCPRRTLSDMTEQAEAILAAAGGND